MLYKHKTMKLITSWVVLEKRTFRKLVLNAQSYSWKTQMTLNLVRMSSDTAHQCWNARWKNIDFSTIHQCNSRVSIRTRSGSLKHSLRHSINITEIEIHQLVWLSFVPMFCVFEDWERSNQIFHSLMEWRPHLLPDIYIYILLNHFLFWADIPSKMGNAFI